MTKQQIHQLFIDHMAAELESITSAARNTMAMATDEEHKADSKYDTFSLESSYLAHGQAMRVQQLTETLERLRVLPLKELDDSSPVILSALVRLEADDGEKRTLFFGPAGGGEEVVVDGEEIILITKQAPLGQAVLGKKVGDRFDIQMGFEPQTFTVVSIH